MRKQKFKIDPKILDPEKISFLEGDIFLDKKHKNTKHIYVTAEFPKKRDSPKFRFHLECRYVKNKKHPNFVLYVEDIFGTLLYRTTRQELHNNIFKLCLKIKYFVCPVSKDGIDSVYS